MFAIFTKIMRGIRRIELIFPTQEMAKFKLTTGYIEVQLQPASS